ncbi:3-ketosteroid-delta-1-dehydrogenase [Leucobacter chromiireducens]|uniref:3-ketosteroid-delta-1-dehydrogenase n=1 Tax=Leucobacter chromiireducens subsp. chromiireducens TaxID=660067 RepID=A0ABS1SL41_9MICO|nr:3-ketosteroid-delta-1-dehydrogenase [Leucobacter chromiireducens]MBL3688704.1 3-ketosteroid-delta-1-dehydrogenase [Leucobacter chromiireducens subsp. chromiireducens]
MRAQTIPAPRPIEEMTVDLLIVGSGTGLATALAAHERGLNVAVIEKTEYVGGSTARSGGAFWIPANPVLERDGAVDSLERGAEYIETVVEGTSPPARWRPYLDHGAEAVRMIERTTPLRFRWIRGYSDYQPERAGGNAAGRSVEARPFDLARLGTERTRFRPAAMAAPFPMPVTGADYKWLNLIARLPLRVLPRAIRRAVQGIGGKLLGRDYAAGGQAFAGGLFAGVLNARIPIFTETELMQLIRDGERVTGAVVQQGARQVTVTTRRGVVLAAGGFDHEMQMRRAYQSPGLVRDVSLGADGNTGDAIRIGQEVGAGLRHMDQAWWFPAIAPVDESAGPQILLAERSLPGSFMVDASGKRFINEALNYMAFGQEVLRREAAGDPVGRMWLVFDQRYRNDYLFAGQVFPRMPLPRSWYRAGIAHRAQSPAMLARAMGVPIAAFETAFRRFNANAGAGIDEDFKRGNSAYDRYYGDPTRTPNPNLRGLDGSRLYAVEVVLSDLGTCGGLRADGAGRVLTDEGEVIPGLFAQGNTAANAFGEVYPGAGATVGQGIVFGVAIVDAVLGGGPARVR